MQMESEPPSSTAALLLLCSAVGSLLGAALHSERSEKQLFLVKNNYILSSMVASAKYLLI